MANKKMTVIEKYTAVSEMLNGTYKGEFTIEQALAFLTERIEQTAKKNASRTTDNGTKKLTPTQQANEVVKNDLVTHLQVMGCPQTVSNIMKTAYCCIGKSNQYVTQMLTQLKNENRVIRTEEKGKSYYSAFPAEETE